MQEEKCFNIILNSDILRVPCLFTNLVHINPNIFYSLINDHQYYVKSNISKQSLQSFIDFLVNGKDLNISSDNIEEYSQLNQEFQFEK